MRDIDLERAVIIKLMKLCMFVIEILIVLWERIILFYILVGRIS